MQFPEKTTAMDDEGCLSCRSVLKGLAFFVILLGVGALIRWADLSNFFDTTWMDEKVRDHGPAGVLLFIGLSTLFTGAGLPRQIVSFLGGYVYGVLLGSVLALAGTVFGGVLAFYFARFLGRDLIRKFAGVRFQRIDSFLQQSPFTMALVLRFLPVGSNILTNLGAGLSSIRPFPFFGGSLVGYVPQTLVFALLGSGLKVEPVWRISLSLILFLVSAWWGVVLYRKYRAGRLFSEDGDRSESET
ncbi:MAG: TVP38/TMEM64 family protein [Desulfovibrionales bacterium]